MKRKRKLVSADDSELWVLNFPTTEVLDRHEENLLIAATRRGSEWSLNKLFSHNLRLIRSFVYYYSRKVFKRNSFLRDRITDADLFQIAVIGMLRAIQKHEFDSARLMTYAEWWILSFISRALHGPEARLICLPAHVLSDEKVTKKDAALLGSGILARKAIYDPWDAVEERISSEQTLEFCRMENFDSRNFHFLMLYIGEPKMTLESIGRRYGLTRERVRQVIVKVCQRISEKNWFKQSYGSYKRV